MAKHSLAAAVPPVASPLAASPAPISVRILASELVDDIVCVIPNLPQERTISVAGKLDLHSTVVIPPKTLRQDGLEDCHPAGDPSHPDPSFPDSLRAGFDNRTMAEPLGASSLGRGGRPS